MPPFINNVVRAGEYRKRITIQQKTGAPSSDPNDVGAIVSTPTQVLTAWAKLSNTAGREYELGLQVVGESTDIVEMRYQPGIEPEMQVVYLDDRTGKERILDINNITDPEEMHIKLYLFCKEVTS